MQRQSMPTSEACIEALKYNTLGNAEFVKKNYEKACYYFLLALEKDPYLLKANYNLGLSYLNLNKNKEARIYLTKAMQLSKDKKECNLTAYSYYELSRVAYHEKDFEEAIYFANEAIKVEIPEGDEINPIPKGLFYFRLAKCSFLQEKLELAKLNIEKSFNDEKIKSEPEYAEAYFYLGAIHDKRKEYAKAAENYSKAIEINPKNSDYHFNLGRMLEHQKDIFRATHSYYKACQLRPNKKEYDGRLKKALERQTKEAIFAGIKPLSSEEQIHWLTEIFNKKSLLGERFAQFEIEAGFDKFIGFFSKEAPQPDLEERMKAYYKELTQERVNLSMACRILFQATGQANSLFHQMPPDVVKKIITHIPNQLSEPIKNTIIENKFKKPGQ